MTSKAIAPVKTVARVTTNVVVKPVAHVTATAARDTGHVVATGAREVGHVAASVGRLAEREAKRIIRPLVAKNAAAQIHGDQLNGFLGDTGDTAAKAAISAAIVVPATAAVTASVIAAPAAPAVPLILPALVSEVYDTVKKDIMKGLSPTAAVANASAEPWYEQVLYFFQSPIGIATGIGMGVGTYFLLSKPKRKRLAPNS